MTNSALRAFKLDSGISLLNGATTSFGANAEMLDVKAALDAGDGLIVADHPDVISALRGLSSILEEVDPPEGAEPTSLSVSFEAPPNAVPIGVVPQGAPPEQIGVDPHATGPAPDVAAVHADEPNPEEEVGQQTPPPTPPSPEGVPSGTSESGVGDPSSSPRPARFK